MAEQKNKYKHKVRLTEKGRLYFHLADDATKRNMPDQYDIMQHISDGNWHMTLGLREQFTTKKGMKTVFRFQPQRWRDLLINLEVSELIEFE